jgi:hypothetical protein
LQNQKSKINNNNDNNNTYNYSDKVAISSLDIADGLKELLIEHGFTLEELSHIPSSELAELLGIDKYIAQIIESAVMKLWRDYLTTTMLHIIDLMPILRIGNSTTESKGKKILFLGSVHK